jgi:putative aminopeptidase FrvX
MTILPNIDADFLLDFLKGLLNTPSPTGYTEHAVAFTIDALRTIPDLQLERTPKGALLAKWQGDRDDRPRALTAHADTLGAMVKDIKSDGRLKLTQIGGYAWPSVEGEGCTIFTTREKQYSGTIIFNKASVHVYGKEARGTERDSDNMEVRLDVRTESAAETRDYGIEVGDFIAFDPRVKIVNDFIRSRHLDDKAGVACIVAAVHALQNADLKPLQKTYLLVSIFEEVGHGAAASIPLEVCELLAVDMAAIGEEQRSDEYHASLCVKDSGGPYHHGLSQRLRQLAEKYEIPYKVDIYPYYGSDGTGYWRSGGSGAVALIGPGVDASHHYERTHMDTLVATTKWIMAYLLNE